MKEISQDIKDYAHYYKSLYYKDMEKNVLALESSFTKNGIQVAWAYDTTTLNEAIKQLLPDKPYNKVCLDVNDTLNHDINKSTFNETSLSSLIDRQFNVDALIIEADFTIANEGALVFIDKNSQSCFNYVNNVVAIVNIDQVLLNISELPIFLHIKNQDESDFPHDVKIVKSNLTQVVPDVYISTDSKGYNTTPTNVSVIVYANNIDPLLDDDLLASSVFCINCNRCKEVCPVAKITNISPIDIVKNNCLDEYNNTKDIFKQTTLCGLCQEVCPVNIPLTDMLIHEMRIVNKNFSSWKSKNVFKVFSKRHTLNKTTNFFLYRLWMKMLFGKNKMLYNYFLKNKTTYFAIQEDEENPKEEPNNAII